MDEKSKMRVLMAAPYGGVPGGISRWTEHIINYYEQLPIRECEMEVFSISRSVFVNINSSLFFRITSAMKDYNRIIRQFKRKIRNSNYDIMHLVSSASISLLKDMYLLSYSKKQGVKTVIHFRFGRIPELSNLQNWEWKLLKKVIKLADRVVVIDKMSYETLLKQGFRNVVFLPNPVASTVIDIVSKNKPFLKRIPRTILFVGHVVKTKGVFELVEACKYLKDIHLKLIGHIEPSMRLALEKKIQGEDWLELCDEKPYEEVIKEMMSCDVFVLPTYTEGFPNVILESMACGCAMVTTTVGAIPEMLEEESGNCYGMMVEPQKTLQLKVAIEKMLADENLKERCRHNVERRVKERYNIASVWKQMINIWQETLCMS